MGLEKIFYIAELISKQLRGDLTFWEAKELKQWEMESPEHCRLLTEFSHYQFLERKQAAEQLCGKEKAWQHFCERRQDFYHRKKVRMYRLGSVAAVLMIGVSILFFYRQSIWPESVTGDQVVSAGESRAILTLADGQRINLNRQSADTLLLREGAFLNTAAGCIEYNPVPSAGMETVYNCLDVPRKGEYMLVLTDGTKIWLNSESRLKYPVSFQGKERRVFLTGEAFFEVSRNEKQPFIVVAGGTAVQVLGTSFNIRAYADEKCSYTTLVEGSVELSAGEQSLVLQPDEQGIVSASGELDKRKVNVDLYTGWKKGRFIFENQKLEEMMQTLSRWYDVEVFFTSEKVKEALFIGNLKRYDNFNKIVEMLEMTGVAHFRINGNTITISDKEKGN